MAREVGIIIKATDAATKTISSVAGAVEKMADKTEDGIKKAEKTSVGFTLKLNAMMQVAEKAARQIQRVFAATVGASIESRAKSDEMRQAWDKMTKSAHDFGISIGDAVLPAIVAVAKAFEPLDKASASWIKNNEKAIASGSLDAIVAIGKGMTIVFSTAGIVISRAYRFIELGMLAMGRTWHVVAAKIKAPMIGILKTMQVAALLQKDLAGAAAMGKLIDEYGGSEEAVREYSKAIVTALDDQTKLEASIHEVSQSAISAFDAAANAGASFGKVVRQSAADAAAAADAWFADVEKHFAEKAAKAAEKANQVRITKAKNLANILKENEFAIIAAKTEVAEKTAAADAAAGEKSRAAAKKVADAAKDIARDVAGYISSVVGDLRREMESIGEITSDTVQKIAIKSKGNADVVERYVSSVSASEMAALKRVGKTAEVVTETMAIRTKSAGDAMEAVWDRVVDSIITKLTEMLAEKAVLFFADMLLGAATGGGSTAVSAGLGLGNFASKLTMGSFAHGGHVQHAAGGLMVQGGRAGRDSVPIMAMPGERVLSRTETRTYERSSTMMMQPSAPAPAPRPIQLLAFQPDRTSLRRFQRDVWEPEQNILRKRGIVKAYK